jgi:hypothetical protein
MAVYPTQGENEGTWGADCSAYHAVSTDLATGKIKDGAVMQTSAAPTVDAGVANKKYVDDSFVSLSAYTTQDSESNNMLKAHSYKAATAGFVVAYIAPNAADNFLKGFVSASANPASSAANLVQQVGDLETITHWMSISFPVAKDEFFEIATDDTALPVIKWKSFGSLSKPIDQD